MHWGQANNALDSTENNRKVKIQTAGTVSDMDVSVTTNGVSGGTSTFKLRQNGADTSLVCSFTASTTGHVTDSSNTVSVSAGDDLNYRIVHGAATGTITLNSLCSAFEHTTTANAMSVLVEGANTSMAIAQNNNTTYNAPCGLASVNQTTEANGEVTISNACTLKNIGVYVSANGRPVAITYRVRKNRANGTTVASVTGSTTGLFEDTSHSDSFAVDDELAIQYVTGSGTATQTVQTIKVEMESTNGKSMAIAATTGGNTFNAASTLFWSPGGRLNNQGTNGDSIRMKVIEPLTEISNLAGNVTANTITAASTWRLSITNTDSSHTLSIGSSATGQFRSTNTASTTTAGDDLTFKWAQGATGTSMTPRNCSVLISAVAAGAALVKDTGTVTVGVTEAVNMVRGRIQNMADTVGITETIAVAMAKSRVFNDTLGITESLNKAIALKRNINEVVGLTEAVNKAVALTRNTNDIVGITEALNQIRGRIQNLSDVIGVTESFNAVLGKIQNVNDTVGITEAVNAAQNLVRTINDQIAIAETVNQIAGRIRTINDTIGIGEAYNTARNLIRVQNEQLGITEILAKHGDITRTINDDIAILEQAQRNLQLTRVINESIGLAETINSAVGKVRVVNDLVGITELTNSVIEAAAQQITKATSSTISISEAINYALTKQIVRVVNDTVSINEADLIVTRQLSRVINDDIGIVESLNRLSNIVRTINEQIIITEQLDRIQALRRTINDTINLTDTALPVRGVTKVINDVIALSDSQISVMGKVKVIDEALGILEDIVTAIEVNVAPPQQESSMTMALGTPAKRRRWLKTQRRPLRETKFLHPPLTKPTPFKQNQFDIDEFLKKQKQRNGEPKEPKELPIQTIKVEASLTLRWDIIGARTITDLLNQLESNAMKAALEKPIPIKQTAIATSMEPITVQSETPKPKKNDIIILKETVESKLNIRTASLQTVENSLSLRWATLNTTEPKALNVRTAALNTVEASLTLRWNTKDSKDWKRLQVVKARKAKHMRWAKILMIDGQLSDMDMIQIKS